MPPSQGLGPRFKLVMTVRNDGASHVRDLPVLLLYNERLYNVARRHMTLPVLVPTVSYTFEVRAAESALCFCIRGRIGGMQSDGVRLFGASLFRVSQPATPNPRSAWTASTPSWAATPSRCC